MLTRRAPTVKGTALELQNRYGLGVLRPVLRFVGRSVSDRVRFFFSHFRIDPARNPDKVSLNHRTPGKQQQQQEQRLLC
jgi:hypothetical protein